MMSGFQLPRLAASFGCLEFTVRLGLRDPQEQGMSAGVHAEAIKGTFVVGEEWRDSKIKISQLADILPGNPQSPAKMVHSRNTEWCVIAEEVWEDQKMCWTLNWEPGFSRCKSTRSLPFLTFLISPTLRNRRALLIHPTARPDLP